MQVDFAIECLDDTGPTGYLREVATVYLIRADGTKSGMFYRASDLADYLLGHDESTFQIVAEDVLGPPRTDLFARFLCTGEP